MLAQVLPAPDPAASFAALYAEAAGRLVLQVYLVTGDVEEARDCVQEGFAKAWLRWDELCREVENPLGWIYTVSYRTAVSRFRRSLTRDRALRRAGIEEALPGPGPDVIAVRDALARLPHAQRATLVLHYYEGLTVEAIATTLGVTTSAVKARLARGRAALHPLLSDTPARGTRVALPEGGRS